MAQTQSRLLALPPELRNVIWELTLLRSSNIRVENDIFAHDIHVGESVQPSLALVSRQVRCEALPIYYSANTFELYTILPAQWYITFDWLRSNKHHLNHLRKLRCSGYSTLDKSLSDDGAKHLRISIDVGMWPTMDMVCIDIPANEREQKPYAMAQKGRLHTLVCGHMQGRVDGYLTGDEWADVFGALAEILDWRYV
ncbi:hypothetical protein LTR85_002392 [Meristemomyces frigidus]|nr:hypothetical protein LTR85_002392 [Meristemomyces frigidus]